MSANGVSQRVRVIGVTLLRSGAHQTPGVRRTLQALGLKKINTTIYHKNIQPVRGMLLKVKHLIAIKSLPEPAEPL